ncbi:Hpt domain-containing protein [Meridianimarinicoccus sp. RP-17]
MDEIWDLFADDGAQALDAMEAALLALQDGSAPDPSAEIGALFRAVHTFKGNARVLGLSTVENRAHLSEDLIGLVRDEGVALTADILDVLLLSCDTLRTMLEETAATRADVEPGPSETLTARLRDVIAQSTQPDGAGVPGSAPAKVAAIADALAALDTADDAAAPDADPAPAPAAPDETAAPAAALDAENAPPRLIDDPTYCEIFEDMARDTIARLADMCATDGPDMAGAAGRAADKLSYAARQMGLADWQAHIDPFVAKARGAGGVNADHIADLAAGLERLLAVGIGKGAAPVSEPEPDGSARGAAQTAVPEDWNDLPTDPVAACQPEPAPAPAPAEPAAPPAPKRMQDPAFVEIFDGMVTDTIARLGKLVEDADPETPARAARLADQLSYAAGQMGLETWQARLDPFVAQARAGDGDIPAAIQALRVDLGELKATWLRGSDALGTRDSADPAGECAGTGTDPVAAFPNSVPAKDSVPPVPTAVADDRGTAQMPGDMGHGAAPPTAARDTAGFLFEMQAFYPRISEIGLHYHDPNGQPEAKAQDDLCDGLAALAAAYGYVALDAAADTLRAARDAVSYRAAELGLFEALARIERVLPSVPGTDVMLPSRLLETWCADSVYDTLVQLRDTLDALKHADDRAARFADFERQMWLVHHACNHFRMETAAQLSMALLDLFSRVMVGNVAPDAMLLRIARGYVETLELVFDALEQGDTPDLANIDALFEAASTACFTSSGVVSARSIETRLNLPESFHRVLSPDSVRAAQAGIEDRMTFYIVRADLNRDQTKAEAFLDWLGLGRVRMITNVTVFTGDDVLFDFLLASRLDTTEIVEALAMIDPGGRDLELVQTLVSTLAEPPDPAVDHPEAPGTEPPLSSASIASTIEMIEMIGEMAAGQAMVQHMLSALSGRDLLLEMEMALRESGLDLPDPQVWRVLRDRVEDYGDRLVQVADAEAQLSEQVSWLQEAGVALRSRSAQALLQSLAAFVETRSRAMGREARLSSEGGELAMDQTILEEMRTHMRALLTMRLSDANPPTRYHVAIMREDDGVIITLEDNGGPLPDDQVVDEIAQDLALRSGSLRVSEPPTGGMRFHLMLPLNMMVLDGMIVRVADVSYVIPLDAIQGIQMCGRRDILNVSAEGHARMLRVSEAEHIPIHDLQGARRAHAADPRDPDERLYVIVRSAARHVALPVDELLGQQKVLLRPLRGVLSRMRGLTGIVLLAGGDVGMVLSVSRLEAA